MAESSLGAGAVAAACNIWQFTPARLLAGFPSIAPTALTTFGRFMNDLCSDQPNFVPPPANLRAQQGRCPVPYNVARQWGATNRDTGVTDRRSLTTQVMGPVTILGVLEITPGSRGLYARSGEGLLIQLSDLYSNDLWRGFFYAVTNMTRVDGQPDNCGQQELSFEPPFVEEGDQNGIEYPDPTFFPPNVNIDLPIRLIPRIFPVGIDVQINGVLEFNINMGGINFNIGSNNGAPPVELWPITDRLDSLNDFLVTFQTEVNTSLTNTNTLVNDLVDDVEDIVEDTNTIADQTRLIGTPLSIPKANDTDVCLTQEVFVQTLFEAIRVVGGEVVEDRQRECSQSESEEQLVAEGESTINQRSVYVSVPPTTIRARLELVGDLPSKASFYQTNEATGNFGALSAIANERAMGTTQTVFTRDTLLLIDPEFPLREIRVFLTPGIDWKLYIVERI